MEEEKGPKRVSYIYGFVYTLSRVRLGYASQYNMIKMVIQIGHAVFQLNRDSGRCKQFILSLNYRLDGTFDRD
jgi:hypothetical protein